MRERDETAPWFLGVGAKREAPKCYICGAMDGLKTIQIPDLTGEVTGIYDFPSGIPSGVSVCSSTCMDELKKSILHAMEDAEFE